MARYIDAEALKYTIDNIPAIQGWTSMLDRIHEWIDHAHTADVAPSWVPADQNPPEGCRYLTVRMDHVTRTAFIDLLWFDNGEWWNRRYRGNWDVLWWMPLPGIPKMDGGEDE